MESFDSKKSTWEFEFFGSNLWNRDDNIHSTTGSTGRQRHTDSPGGSVAWLRLTASRRYSGGSGRRSSLIAPFYHTCRHTHTRDALILRTHAGTQLPRPLVARTQMSGMHLGGCLGVVYTSFFFPFSSGEKKKKNGKLKRTGKSACPVNFLERRGGRESISVPTVKAGESFRRLLNSALGLLLLLVLFNRSEITP